MSARATWSFSCAAFQERYTWNWLTTSRQQHFYHVWNGWWLGVGGWDPSTFVKASKWLKEVRDDERVWDLLEQYDISLKFNLSRAPWWGGQFERLIGVVKSALYEVIDGATFIWDELCDVILDVEIQINRRPTLTPNTFLFQRTSDLPESEPRRIEETDLRKRAKYLITCKNLLWGRWKREYLTSQPYSHYPKVRGQSRRRGYNQNRWQEPWEMAACHCRTFISWSKRCYASCPTENEKRPIWNTRLASIPPRDAVWYKGKDP